MDQLLVEMISKLDAEADERTKLSGERYFKENVRIRGLRNARVSAIGKEYFRLLPVKDKNYVFGLCTQLWETGFMEDSLIACQWSFIVRKQYTPDDFAVFEAWVSEYVSNWASCDTLCNHSTGTLVEKFPALIAGLKAWTLSANRWVKRASAVSLIVPARKGLFLDHIFDIADKLLTDRDDMVQKGYGWMLKSASQANPDAVFEFVMRRKKIMPRTSLRYAIEKMPESMRSAAMAK